MNPNVPAANSTATKPVIESPHPGRKHILPAASAVEKAIATASRQTAVDFDFLLAQAEVESSLNPSAKASTSSASGLFQFIDSTWLGTMKRHGERFGLGDVAAKISLSPNGRAFVADPAQRQAILAMRFDPEIAAQMAAGLAEDNRAHLTPIIGRTPDHGELYLAHFLGAGGAGRFLSAMAANPDQSAATLFPRPAAANRAVFFEPDGSARSLGEVKDFLSAKLERAMSAASGRPPAMPPYILAEQSVFGPLPPQPNRRADRSQAALPGPGITRAPMSQVLQSVFGNEPTLGGSSAGSARVRQAYSQLKAFGL